MMYSKAVSPIAGNSSLSETSNAGQAGLSTLLDSVRGLAKGQGALMLPDVHQLLQRSFDVLRNVLRGQASSSRDMTLLALECLEQRGFKPATGGLEIPMSGIGLGGARTVASARIQVQIQRLTAAREQLVTSLASKGRVIRELSNDLQYASPSSSEYQGLVSELQREQGVALNLTNRIRRLDGEISMLNQQLREIGSSSGG